MMMRILWIRLGAMDSGVVAEHGVVGFAFWCREQARLAQEKDLGQGD